MLPGDKSISHRYAMLAGFAEGTSRLTNFSTGADPHSSLACMEAMGAQVSLQGQTLEITGTAGALAPPSGDLDCGNSGSTMRMLAGLVAAQNGLFRFTGDESLTNRPMERIRKPLEQMGARIALTEGHAPMIVNGTPLSAIDFDAPIASAQVKTAVLFAGLQAKGTTSIVERSARAITPNTPCERSERSSIAKTAVCPLQEGKASTPLTQPFPATCPRQPSSSALLFCSKTRT